MQKTRSVARPVAVLLALMLLAGCTTPLYTSGNHVSVHLHGTPVIEQDYYEIQFRFESPTDDPDLIQWIEMHGWTGVESFSILIDGKTSIDTHRPARGTSTQHRRITIAPGKVADTDKTFWGFSMLPSGWPENFNADYRARCKIQGHVVYRKPEHETVYILNFADGVLTWHVEGTDIVYTWSASDTVK